MKILGFQEGECQLCPIESSFTFLSRKKEINMILMCYLICLQYLQKALYYLQYNNHNVSGTLKKGF